MQGRAGGTGYFQQKGLSTERPKASAPPQVVACDARISVRKRLTRLKLEEYAKQIVPGRVVLVIEACANCHLSHFCAVGISLEAKLFTD